MSVADVLLYLAAEAEGTATRTGRKDWQRVAVMLLALGERERRLALRKRGNQAARRARLAGESKPAMSPEAYGDAPAGDGAWTATKRTAEMVTLRKLR